MIEPTISRRGALIGGTCLFGWAGAVHARTAARAVNCPVVTAPPPVTLTPAERQRHGIYLSLTAALLFDGWGVDQHRPEQIVAYAAEDAGRRFPDYLGHNIGALLVDRTGATICFALNRDVQFDSMLEHAEARTIRAAIQPANAARPPADTPPWTFGALLRQDCLYTMLEPCAQCTGIMDLTNAGDVIYAQDDPGQRHIVNVLYQLDTQPRGPLPIRGTYLSAWNKLAVVYRQFAAGATPGARTGLTSFLETVGAYRVYRQAATEFETMAAREPGNDAILRDARSFRDRWRGGVQSGLVPV